MVHTSHPQLNSLLIKTHGRVSCGQVQVRETLCYLLEPTFSRFQLFIAQKLLS